MGKGRTALIHKSIRRLVVRYTQREVSETRRRGGERERERERDRQTDRSGETRDTTE